MKIEDVSMYTPTGTGNFRLICDGFAVSYNPNPCADISFFGSDGGSDETALCVDGQYFILNGDFRAKYAKLSKKGLNACLQFFIKNAEGLSSTWSDSAISAREIIEGDE